MYPNDKKDQELQISLIKLKEEYFQQRVSDQNKLQEQLKVLASAFIS